MFTAPIVFGPNFSPERMMNRDQYQLYMQRYNQLKPRFPWSEKLEPVYAGYLVHRSTNVPGKIGYFQNLSAMIDNRFTRTSPEMFLARALGQAPEMIRAAWSVEVCGNILPPLDFIENDDPQGWVDVYEHGPHSCMAGATQVRQYACEENNLALAYMKDNGKIIARAIVNRENMHYVRAYIAKDKPEEMPTFITALNMAGFTQADDALVGERINVEFGRCYRCDCKLLRGPYIDGAAQSVRLDPYAAGSLSPRTGVIHSHGDEVFTADDEELHCGCEEGDDWNDDDYGDDDE